MTGVSTSTGTFVTGNPIQRIERNEMTLGSLLRLVVARIQYKELKVSWNAKVFRKDVWSHNSQVENPIQRIERLARRGWW